MAQLQNQFTTLGIALAVNFNTSGDTVIPINNAANYFATNVYITNGSATPTNFIAKLRTAASGGGSQVVQLDSGINFNGSLVAQYTTDSPATYQTGANYYLNVSTPEGTALTGDVFIVGYIIS